MAIAESTIQALLKLPRVLDILVLSMDYHQQKKALYNKFSSLFHLLAKGGTVCKSVEAPNARSLLEYATRSIAKSPKIAQIRADSALWIPRDLACPSLKACAQCGCGFEEGGVDVVCLVRSGYHRIWKLFAACSGACAQRIEDQQHDSASFS